MAPDLEKSVAVTFEDFLTGTPPGTFSNVSNLGTRYLTSSGDPRIRLLLPEISLYCSTPKTCEGDRVFKSSEDISAKAKERRLVFVVYTCKNCSTETKVFALWFMAGDDAKSGAAYKYGELPDFGPPTPSRLISLIGPQKNLYLKGRRAENQGMGIAAFAYYRRVIEDQKDRIFDEIIKVARRV